MNSTPTPSPDSPKDPAPPLGPNLHPHAQGTPMPEHADDAMPDAAPSTAHSFSKESMIIEPPTFQEMPDLEDVQTPHFWNLLWFNYGRPILLTCLWVAGALLVMHVAVNWRDMPRPVLAIAIAVTALLLLASLQRRFFPRKARKNIERTHGSEVSAFFGTDKLAHRELRHSKRIDVYFDGTRVALVSEKQAQLTPGKLPFGTKKADGRALRTLNPEGVAQAKEAGMQMGK